MHMSKQKLYILIINIISTFLGRAALSEELKCMGIYKDVRVVPVEGDLLGAGLTINDEKNIIFSDFSGEEQRYNATEIKIVGQKIWFKYHDSTFNGECINNKIKYTGYDYSKGRQSENLVMKFIRKTDQQLEKEREDNIRKIQYEKELVDAKSKGFNSVEDYRQRKVLEERLIDSGIKLNK